MLAALRVELAGEALVLEGTCPPEGCSLSALRIAAEAHGADQVVWVTFPQGEIAPPHINAVRATGALEREALLPSAWDVAEPRVMAAVTASLLESEEPEPESTAPFTGSTTPISEQSVAPEEDIEVPHGATPGPFSMQFGLAYGHHTGPQGPTELAAAPVVLAFYGQLTDWIALGIRLRGFIGASSIEGFAYAGLLGVPSLMLTLRETLSPLLGIRWGLHLDGGVHFSEVERPAPSSSRDFNNWSFGLGLGAYITLEIGPHHGIQIDYDINMYGFGERGAFFDGMGSLNYVYRFQ